MIRINFEGNLMGCFESKHIDKNQDKSNTTNLQKKSQNFNLSASDLVGEKSGSIKDDYTLLMPALGKGSFGEVRKAIHKVSNLVRAVKLILKSSISKEEEEKMKNEVSIMKKLDHPNILKVFEFYQDTKYFYIVTELCTGGELFDKIINKKFFNEQEAANTMVQVLYAVAYCHKHRIVHRDLKPENLLLESKKDDSPIKVIDFGTSREFNPKIKMNQKFGTILYMAPEIFTGTYDEKCDMWSCGVIAYILLCGYPPFNERSDKETIERIKEGNYIMPREDWDGISDDAKDFVKKLLTIDPKKRLSAEEAMQHSWILNRKDNKMDKPLAQKALTNLKTFRADKKLEQAAWVFLVSYLATKEEKNELLKTFQSLDLNGDGQLSKEELLIGYKKIMPEDEAEKEVNTIMSSVDTNNSGFIDYSEFVTASVNKKNLVSKEKLEIAFNMFDKDASGSISIDELKGMFQGAGDKTDKMWNEVISEVDKNGDGEISLVEFKEMMTKLTEAGI